MGIDVDVDVQNCPASCHDLVEESRSGADSCHIFWDEMLCEATDASVGSQLHLGFLPALPKQGVQEALGG
jgi:hypothetical protein